MFSTQKPLPLALYVIGVVVIFIAVYTQYFVSIHSAILGYLIIYGIPIAVTGAFFGTQILRRAAKNNLSAVKYGFGMFGILTIINLVLSVIAIVVLTLLNPQTPDILQRPNPALPTSSSAAWILVALSFLVIGPAEEFLFRGFMYGGLLNLSKGKHWLPLAVLASVLFAMVHGYYALTYDVASIVPFFSLITFGFAMCATYYYTDGNLLIPILIHGLYDATGFLTVAISTEVGTAARFVLIAASIAAALYLILKKVVLKPFPQEQPPAPPPAQTPPSPPPPENQP